MENPSFLYLCPENAKLGELYPKGVQENKENSGIDIVTPVDTVVEPGQTVRLSLGIKAVRLVQTPGDYHPRAFYLYPRSSLGSKTTLLLTNSVGVIDKGYRGPLQATVLNYGQKPFVMRAGVAYFQLTSPDLAPLTFQVIAPDGDVAKKYFGEGVTIRGAGGFGSTGPAGSAACGPTDL